MRAFTSARAGFRVGLLFSAGVFSLSLDMASGVSYPLQLSSVSESHSSLYEESLKHPEQFWGDLAGRRLRWIKKFDQVMDCDMRSGQFKWFLGGVINVSGKPALVIIS